MPMVLRENELTGAAIDSAIRVHRELGPGLLESVYEVCLAHELRKRGLKVERQVTIPIQYDGIRFDAGFRADLIIESLVIVELKSVESLTAAHRKQIQTQLRLTRLRAGLLINFGQSLLKDGIVRAVNDLPEPS